jgi:hypothetical protein
VKVTAILPDEMVEDVKAFSGGKNITDSLIRALNDWLYLKRIEKLNDRLSNSPVTFEEGYSAEKVRNFSNRHDRS